VYFLVLLGFLVLFAALFMRALLLLRGSSALFELAEQDKMKHAVGVSIWFNCVLHLAMVVACLFLLYISFQDAFNGFTNVTVKDDTVELGYMWPMPRIKVSREEIKNVETKKWGKNSMVLEFSIANGRKYKSASVDSDLINGFQADFLKDLAKPLPPDVNDKK